MILDNLLRNSTAGGVGGIVGVAPKIIFHVTKTYFL